MSYADELLELAQEIANLHPAQRHQSSLRRAVSTAYYALFHLLISEATASWVLPELRSALARVFDHGPMKQAADKKVAELKSYFDGQPVEGRERTVGYHLYNVADVFGQAQYHRNEADYNTARQWELMEVLLHIDSIADAFKAGTSFGKNHPHKLIWCRCCRVKNAGKVRDGARKSGRPRSTIQNPRGSSSKGRIAPNHAAPLA